jgi:CO/xanthine dehydrogenase Mo-binding subunit
MAIAARKAGRPVKWVEERIEHLVAATSATNRVTTLSAAVGDDGVVTARDRDQLEDCGAYLRGRAGDVRRVRRLLSAILKSSAAIRCSAARGCPCI